MLGRFYGIGVGPGDPDLITLRGLRALHSCKVIAFPAGRAGQKGIAEAIVGEFLQNHHQLLPLDLPFVQDLAILEAAWQKAAGHVLAELQQGKNVAFIAEGDVSFYSTFTYLMLELRGKCSELEINIIPGISSPMAAVAALGIPLTIWADKLAVLPALHSVAELESALQWAEVVVLMKVSRVYREVWQILRSHNLLTNAHVIAWVTTPQQQIWSDLTNHSHLSLPYFSMLIVSRSKIVI